jgi:hypothetical protein
MMPPGRVWRIDRRFIHSTAWKEAFCELRLPQFSEVRIAPAPTSQTIRGGEGPITEYHRGRWAGKERSGMSSRSWSNSARLEQVRERARRQGGPEGERLEAQSTARLREIEQRIADLRASLE